MKGKWLTPYILLGLQMLSLESYSQNSKKENWICKCENTTLQTIYNRTYLNDTTFIDEESLDQNSTTNYKDTFVVKGDELFYQRGNKSFAYFSKYVFERGDTIKMFSHETIDTKGLFYIIGVYYLPKQKIIFQGEEVLVYKLLDFHDSPKNSMSEIYYSPSSKRIVYSFSVETGKCFMQALK